MGGCINKGPITFNSIQDVLIDTAIKWSLSSYQFILDRIILGHVNDISYYTNNTHQHECHYTYIKQLPEHAEVTASFPTKISEISIGSKVARREKFAFNTMKTNEMWDCGDRVTGTYSKVENAFELHAPSFMRW